MATIFYLFALVFIWRELIWLESPVENTKKTQKFFELSQLNKGKNGDEFSEEYTKELKKRVYSLPIFIWIFLGLFTFQWAGFLAIILFNILIISPLSKITRFSTTYTVLHWINSLIGFLFGVFVIVNHFYLRIDLTQFFMSIFK